MVRSLRYRWPRAMSIDWSKLQSIMWRTHHGIEEGDFSNDEKITTDSEMLIFWSQSLLWALFSTLKWNVGVITSFQHQTSQSSIGNEKWNFFFKKREREKVEALTNTIDKNSDTNLSLFPYVRWNIPQLTNVTVNHWRQKSFGSTLASTSVILNFNFGRSVTQ